MSARPADEGRTDEELMARVAADDSIAFAELYRRHVDRAFRVAQGVGLDAGRAEDALDSAFATIWRRRGAFRPELGTFRAWAMTIVQNRAREVARGDRDEAPAVPIANPTAGHRRDGAAPVPIRLPEPLAEIVILAFHGEVGREEIATHLALAPPPIEGRMRLAAELEDAGGGDEGPGGAPTAE